MKNKYLTLVLHLLIFTAVSIQDTTAKPTYTAKQFFQAPSVLSVKVSPEGNKLIKLKLAEKKQMLVLQDTKAWKEAVVLRLEEFTDNNSYVSNISWIDNRFVAAQFSELKDGIEGLADKRISRRLIIVDTQKSNDGYAIKSVRTKGWLLHPLPTEPGKFLFAKVGASSRVFKLDVAELSLDKAKIGKFDKVDGGQFVSGNLIKKIDAYVLKWFGDTRGNIDAVLTIDREAKLKIIEYDNQGEENVIELRADQKQNEKPRKKKKSKRRSKTKTEAKEKTRPEKLLLPFRKANGNSRYYCVDINATETKAIYLVDYKEDTQDVVYETKGFRIVDIGTTHEGELNLVLVENNGSIEYEYVNVESSQTTSPARSRNPRLRSIVSQDTVGKSAIFYEEAHNSPGRFIYRQPDKKSERVIARRSPQLPENLPTELRKGSVEVEGLKINYLLSMPQGKNSAPRPMVVMPHGGPIGVYDNQYYDSFTQYFAANGMAVLRVNFRGSSGYSRELLEAGKKQWGKLMLTDIVAATKQVLTRPDIDSARVCVFGLSYGGYASTMLGIKHSDLFKCAASAAGVSDVNLYLTHPQLSEKNLEWAREYVGDQTQEYDALKAISPLYNIAQLKIPYLLAHGAKDKVVDLEHSNRLKMALEKHGIPFTWYLDEASGHQFSVDGGEAKLASRVFQFLQHHLKL